MKKNWVLILGICCLWLSWVAHGEVPMAERLDVLVKPTKPTVLMGEPLLVSVEIKNPGDRDLLVGRAWRSIGAMQLSTDNVKFRAFCPLTGTDMSAGCRIPAHGQVLERRIILWNNCAIRQDEKAMMRTYAFPQPGQYWIRLHVRVQGDLQTMSEPVEITVVEPEGNNLAIWNVLQQVEGYGNFMQFVDYAAGPADTAGALAGCLRAHPNTVYSHHLALALGKHYFHLSYSAGTNPDLNKQRAEWRSKAVEYFNMAARMTHVAEMREEGFLFLVRTAPDEQKATMCEQAFVEFPNGLFKSEFESIRDHVREAANLRWRDPIYAVHDELKTLGYDLTLYPEIEERMDRELAEMQRDAKRQLEAGQITWREYRTIAVQKYKQWVVANLTPHATDRTPPVITLLGPNPVPAVCGDPYSDAGATALENKDGNLTGAIMTTNTVNTATGGTYTVTYKVRDAAGNETTATRTVNVLFNFTGFLPPIGGAGATGGTVAKPVKTFKAGSKIPVKFTLTCGNAAVNTGIHTLQVIKWSNETTAAAPIDASPADAATQGNQFRWADDHWQYVLDTKATNMGVGVWELRATLSDGSKHSAFIGLK